MAFKDVMYSTFTNKCPRCHEGNFFENNNPYSFHNGLKMNKHCPTCGLKYERETGYFYGAMFVSYALQVIVFVTLFALNALWWKLDAPIIILIISACAIALFPITFRHSRLLWVSLFTKYNPAYGKGNSLKDVDIQIK